MMKKRIIILLKRYDIWQWTQIILIGSIVISSGLLVEQLVVSPCFENDAVYTPISDTVVDGNLAEIAQIKSSGFQEVGETMRPGLFKSENPQHDKPLADKTIERIKSQLKLQCIMDLDGESVAYVKVKGEGMKRCRSGDTVSNLFTVLNINETSVEITIVGHRELLSF
jgi:hypothetical protein